MAKKLVILVSVFVVFLPVTALAHGGVEHNTDDAVVQLFQKPLSPVAREYVVTDFIFTAKDGSRLRNIPVKLTLTDTHEGDASKDQVVLERSTKTDANGIVSFGYRYAKPDFYDIDLDFEVNGRAQEAGFLLGIRNPYKNWYTLGYIVVLLAGIGLGWLAAWRFSRQKKKAPRKGPPSTKTS
jgi:hypothetical protein